MAQIGFTVACKKFFGIKPGQELKDFSTEVRMLTQKDREEMAPSLSVVLGTEVSLEFSVSQG